MAPNTPVTSSRSSSASDLDLEIITSGSTSFVTFEELKKSYSDGESIEVSYFLDQSYRPSTRDWVGLYLTDRKKPHNYMTFEWAPKYPDDVNCSLRRKLLFQGKNIQSTKGNDDTYRFMYITSFDDVIGISGSFRLGYGSPSSPTEEASFVCIERPLVSENSDTEDCGFHLVDSTNKGTEISARNVQKTHSITKQARDSTTLNKEFADVQQRWKIPESDSNLNQYHQNKERAVMPYRTVPHLYQLAANWKRCHSSNVSGSSTSCHATNTPIIAQVSVGTTPDTKCVTNDDKVSACTACADKRRQYKVIQAKCKTFRKDAQRLQKQLEDAEGNMSVKTVLLDELARQVKQLVHENVCLTITNDRLSGEKSDTSIQSVPKRELSQKELKLSRRNQALCQKMLHLQRKNSKLLAERDILLEKDRQSHRTIESLEQKLVKYENTNIKLEKRLDDVMYTLSTQGYTKMIDTDGHVVELANAKGSVLQLTGWSMALSKKHGRDLSIYQLQEALNTAHREMEQLRTKCTDQKSNLVEAKEKVDKLKEQYKKEEGQCHYYKQKIQTLGSQLTSLLDQRCSLAHTLHEQERLHDTAMNDQSVQKNKIEEDQARLKQQLEVYQSKMREIRETQKSDSSKKTNQALLRFAKTSSTQISIAPAHKAVRVKTPLPVPGVARPVMSDASSVSPCKGNSSASQDSSDAQSSMSYEAYSPESYDSSIIMWSNEVGSLSKFRRDDNSSPAIGKDKRALIKTSRDRSTQMEAVVGSVKKRPPRKFVATVLNKPKSAWVNPGNPQRKYVISGASSCAMKPAVSQNSRSMASCPHCALFFPPNVSPGRVSRHIMRHRAAEK